MDIHSCHQLCLQHWHLGAAAGLTTLLFLGSGCCSRMTSPLPLLLDITSTASIQRPDDHVWFIPPRPPACLVAIRNSSKRSFQTEMNSQNTEQILQMLCRKTPIIVPCRMGMHSWQIAAPPQRDVPSLEKTEKVEKGQGQEFKNLDPSAHHHIQAM